MTTTVVATSDAPGLTARLRLPRHHVGQRNQAIADALDLVDRLERLLGASATSVAPETPHQVSDALTPDIDDESTEWIRPNGVWRLSPANGHLCCMCEWGGYWRSDPIDEIEKHERLTARLTSTSTWEIADLIEEAITWEELHETAHGGIPPWHWRAFVSQHNWPDPVATYQLVGAIRMARQGMHAWHEAPREKREAWDERENV